ncbi:hypothetical protein Efla_006264 [Eimeria flavescens]
MLRTRWLLPSPRQTGRKRSCAVCASALGSSRSQQIGFAPITSVFDIGCTQSSLFLSLASAALRPPQTPRSTHAARCFSAACGALYGTQAQPATAEACSGAAAASPTTAFNSTGTEKKAPVGWTRSSVEVDIKRDQQLLLKMFAPLHGVLLNRIAACAPNAEAKALTDYYSKVVEYNCRGGKLMRGLMTVYASLAPKYELHFRGPAAAARAACLKPAAAAAAADSQEQAAAAAHPALAAAAEAFASPVCYLGWGVELLQAAFLVADDQMDGATTRRGNLCWYRRPDVGPANAINDAVFLIFAIYQVISEFLGGHACFGACVDLLQEVAFKTVLGQHLDTNGHLRMLQQQLPPHLLRRGGAAAEEALKALTAAARSRQMAAARLKTSHYSFWLPTALGLRYSGIEDPVLLDRVKTICLSIGDFFQAQDDYLDCFGCPTALGKASSDIREGKCSWLFADALAAATPSEAADLVDKYGSAEGEEAVRQLYVHLNVQGRFKAYERETRNKILRLIEELDHAGLQSYFAALLQILYGRPQ